MVESFESFSLFDQIMKPSFFSAIETVYSRQLSYVVTTFHLKDFRGSLHK